jgi:hypothetical protein
MELKIDRFKDIASLVAEKDELRRKNEEWLKRQKELRDFYNGQPIMSETDADEEDLEDITNHLIGYSNMQVIETRYYSIWSSSNKFIDVNVTDEDLNLEQRDQQSAEINKFINAAIYKTTRFGAFCRSVAGEISMAGRAACIHKEDSDWCPSVSPKLMLPDSVGTDASELTYAFAPKELTHAELEAMLSEDGGSDEKEEEGEIENEVTIDEDVVRQLMATIDHQVSLNDSQMSSGSESERHEQNNTDKTARTGNKTTVNVWYYYEIRFDEESESKVVDLLVFTDEFRMKGNDGEPRKGGDESQNTQAYIAHYPAFYSRPSEWAHLIVVDASIGGDKRFATAKGIAEITFSSDMDSEELLSRIFTGEKMRAIPRFQEGDNSNEDALLGWSHEESTMVPKDVKEFRFGGNTGGLSNPLGLLRQNSSSQSGAGHSNSGRDGELRTQSVERQSNSQATNSSRISDLFKSYEIIGHEMVRRFFVGEVEGGSPGYEEIMWFRSKCKKREINLKKLAESSFGFYDNIEVKIVKSSATGEIDHDVSVARQLMDNLSNFPPAVRPLIVRKFVTLLTGDPDFSDGLVELLPKIISAQRVTAESEFEQIRRDALVGIDTPLGEEDVHIEHIPTHNKHLQSIINEGLIAKWTRKEAVHFGGLQVHQQKHLEEALLNDVSRAEAEQHLREFESIVNEGQQLLQEVERGELEEEGKSDKEIEMQLKIAEQGRKQQESDRKDADTMSVIENRKQRREDVRRQGDQRFLVDKERVTQEKE